MSIEFKYKVGDCLKDTCSVYLTIYVVKDVFNSYGNWVYEVDRMCEGTHENLLTLRLTVYYFEKSKKLQHLSDKEKAFLLLKLEYSKDQK